MEPDRPIPAPRPVSSRPAARPAETYLVDVRAAIDLVANGLATRVVVGGLLEAESIAGLALSLAQAAGVDFALERDEETGAVAIIVGPLTPS
jgi:hypothetical protein